MKELDTGKIITTLLIGAIVWLFTSINTLNDSVKSLSNEIALIQQYNDIAEVQWQKRGEVVEDYRNIVSQLSDRINRLEWHLDEDKQ